jgi:hypothetical protein
VGRRAGAHRRGEDSPLVRSADLDPIREKRSRFAFRGDWKFHFKQRKLAEARSLFWRS